MRRSRRRYCWSGLLALGVISLPVAASSVAEAAAPTTAIGGQVVELKGSDTVAGDNFGGMVAISGTNAIAGAPYHAGWAGRAYVYTKTATGWKQAAELKASDSHSNDQFGRTVAIAGNTAVVGAWNYADYTNQQFGGRAYVFTKTTSGWKQAAELRGSDTVLSDEFGWSVAVTSGTVVVGAPMHDNYTGRTYVFSHTASGWKQAAELKGSDIVGSWPDEPRFGLSVAVSGTTVVVGAWGPAKYHYAGRAYVFSKTTSGWKQAAELKGSDTVAGDNFGTSVAISGTTAVVGAWGHASGAGRAYVFSKTTSGWKQSAELKGSDTVAKARFGSGVAVAGTVAVVGAYNAKGAGRAYVFTKTASGWKQAAEMKGSDTVSGDCFGYSTAVSGTTALVGAWGHASGAGRAYIFVA